MQRAVDAIMRGGVLIYPTETLYALGGDARNPEAAAAVVALKGRPQGKPLPLVIGSAEQLEQVTAWQDQTLMALARSFWPGPLSVLVPARDELAPAVSDAQGFTSVRFTAHPTAARLCRLARTPLIATSANRSGNPPAARPEELDPELVSRVAVAITTEPWPGGGAPSTVVRVTESGGLAVLRDGAVSRSRLVAAGFEIDSRCGG